VGKQSKIQLKPLNNNMPKGEGIVNHKLWPLEKIVVKETLQIINALGGDK
jgi:hypothetical protein